LTARCRRLILRSTVLRTSVSDMTTTLKFTTWTGEIVFCGNCITVEHESFGEHGRIADFIKYNLTTDTIFVRFARDHKHTELDPNEYRITYIGE
jgi:hypothetical protein